MNKFDLCDGIIKVTRDGSKDRTAAFFIRTFYADSFLEDIMDSGDLGPVSENLPDYYGFTGSLMYHFGFDEKYDDIQWVDESGALNPFSECPQPKTYVVCGWNSWVTAMTVTQNSQSPSGNCLLPIVTFTIVRKPEKSTCYILSAHFTAGCSLDADVEADVR